MQGSGRGVDNAAQQKERILEAVESLADKGKGQETTSSSIDASWKLLWTTEKVKYILGHVFFILWVVF